MNKLIKIAILETVVLVGLLLVLLFFPKQKAISQVCFEQSCFNVEVADSPAEQQEGLMFRQSLEKDKGMLFVFKKVRNYPFWMKNTLIPLDIIWINQSNEVVFIKKNAQPCSEICESIDPGQNAKYVLELNGGVASETNLKIGDKVSLGL